MKGQGHQSVAYPANGFIIHIWECIGKPYIGSATDLSNSLLDDLERSTVIGHGLQHVAYSDQTVLDGPMNINRKPYAGSATDH